MSFDLTKIKALLMASTCKIAFNIDDLTIHSTFNIFVQQSSFSLPNLSSNSLNRFTCRYEQLQLVVIDEISLVVARMFNVINNRLRSIKQNQNKFFGGVDVIMTSDLFETPLVKDSWVFQNIKDNVNALAPKILQTYVQCYELNKIMQQFDMVFIQTLNKFHTRTENAREISFLNSICNRQPPNNFTIMYLFYINKLVQKHNENVFINTLGPMFIFKAIDINHQSCSPSYKLSNDPSKTVGLHFTICIKKIMLVELSTGNYATFDGLVNEIDDIFKTSTTYYEKTIIWIMFQNCKIGTLTRKKCSHYYNNN